MNQLSAIKIEKLSGTIEELGLDRRAYNVLKRAGINYISNIIDRGEVGILNLKNMGLVTANDVFSAVAKYLNIPKEELFSKETIQAVVSYEERPYDPLENSIAIFGLPFSTIKSLNSLGVFIISDLLKLKINMGGSYDIGELSKSEVRRIITELNLYLSRINWVKADGISVKPIIKPSIIDLSTILAMLLKDERTSRIVELRANQLLTLEEIANETGGVTRERIRQIIDQVHERIRKNLNLINIFCDYFEEIAESFSKRNEGEKFTISVLAEQYKSRLPNERLNAAGKELESLITIIRLLVIHDKPWSEDVLQRRWKKTCFLACSANPPIKKHEEVSRILIKQEEKNKRVSYKELAFLILTNEKKPMHWSKIAERAYRMGRRDSFSSTALYNALMNYSDLFVRVDAGTYALVEWGFNKVDTYPDIIASILKLSRKPLSADAIYHKVNEIRQVKQSTLIMSLDMHPRFYRSLEKTYGLRVWLPPREKQTLRTPEWLVEDSDSFKRLEQAIQKGYDIENMIQADLVNS